MQLPGFRKRKHTLKEKPRPLGTSHFLLLGLLENPDLPIPRPSLFPAQHAAGWGGVQEATGCWGVRPRGSGWAAVCTLARVGGLGKRQKKLSSGRELLAKRQPRPPYPPGKTRGLSGFGVCPHSCLLCLFFPNFPCLEPGRSNSSVFTCLVTKLEKNFKVRWGGKKICKYRVPFPACCVEDTLNRQ